MKWQKASSDDSVELAELSREPMGGRVRLAWGFDQLKPPPDCSNFATYAVKVENIIQGMACFWHWPDGSRYLCGLRFAADFRQRPRPNFWKQAYQDMLNGVSHAWTCIGKENTRARRTLESGASWLPHYRQRQEIRTWFVPIARSKARAPRNETFEKALGLKPVIQRYVAIASGSGFAYRTGRFSHQLGLPGIPPAEQRMRIAYYTPNHGQSSKTGRNPFPEIQGYDGVVVVLPKDSDEAKQWDANRPRLAWTWDSTLYAVSWDASALSEPVPEWKGIWL